ncbi:MAG: phosphatase PAP2 family protein [Polaromonas sp.]|nr:phosphatase PAP2 family protein [Polaromonas sp.]
MTPDITALTGQVQWLATHALPLFGVALLLVLAGVAALWRLAERYGLRRQESRWPPMVYLVGYLLLGFGVIAGAAELFADIAEMLGEPDGDEAAWQLGRLDEVFSGTLRSTLPRPALQTFALLTHLGDPIWLGVICLAVGGWLLWKRQGWLLCGWLLAILGNAVLNRLLKSIFERTRPLHDHGFASADGWSFPSGHTSGSLVVYGMLAYLLVRLLPPHWPAWSRLASVLLATALAFTIGSSRVFLQVHYASDVVAGFASGTTWLAVCIGTLELVRYNRHVRGQARKP